MKNTSQTPLVDVLGTQIAPMNMESALAYLADALKQQRKGYVCLAGVHGVMEAHRNPDLRPVYSDSLLTAPDGMPTVWVGHRQGHTTMRQITGPDLMLEVLSRPEFSSCTHFLYGGKEGVASELQRAMRRRFPEVKIVGTFTPPYQELTAQEEDALIQTIAEQTPTVIWVGISTPRQERFMRHMLPRLQTQLMFGVGAAFDFHTGRIRDCPTWVKRAGLQWLDRLLQDPQRLWKRYLRNNSTFLWHIFLQFSGLRTYPITDAAPNLSPSSAANVALQKAGADH